MASITFNSLKETAKSVDNYTYVDFHLDLQENKIGPQSTWLETTGPGTDIRVAFDLNAIRNSLRNIFSTLPGERALLPDFGADLRRYVFEPINERTGANLGRSIRYAIEQWEPRVQLLNLDIIGVEDQHEYRVTLTLAVPFLSEPLNVRTIFTREGFTFT